MKLNSCNFPHPVMNEWSEDVTYDFEFDISVVPSPDHYLIHYRMNTQNNTLAKLLTNAQAEALIHIECSGCFYRKTFKALLNNNSHELQIEADKLNGKVTICSFICAKKDLCEYFNEEQHSDYGWHTFFVGEGDYLAIGPAHEFYADKDYNPLKRISSFIKITKGDIKMDEPVGVECNGDKVKIILPDTLYRNYFDLKNNPDYSFTLSAVLILPVLVFLITEMHSNKADYEDCIWFKGITNRFEKLQIPWQKSPKSNFELAQLLLDLPVKKAEKELRIQTRK